jgi:hypothetical protein
LCDQEDETVQHLLVSCVFAREVWVQILSKVGLQHLSPGRNEMGFQDWWRSAERRVPAARRKSFNSVVALGAWWIWKHRKSCVFEGSSPSVVRVVQDIKDEAGLWCLARAVGVLAMDVFVYYHFWPP